MLTIYGAIFIPNFLTLLPDEESDSDAEEKEEKMEKKHRRRSSSDKHTTIKVKYLKKHPLTIHFNVTCSGKDLVLNVRGKACPTQCMRKLFEPRRTF